MVLGPGALAGVTSALPGLQRLFLEECTVEGGELQKLCAMSSLRLLSLRNIRAAEGLAQDIAHLCCTAQPRRGVGLEVRVWRVRGAMPHWFTEADLKRLQETLRRQRHEAEEGHVRVKIF